MTNAGFHQYPPIDQVIFGKPAGLALREETEKRDAKRVLLIVSKTLSTQTDEIEKTHNALGGRYAGTFDGVPQRNAMPSVFTRADPGTIKGPDDVVDILGLAAWRLAVCKGADSARTLLHRTRSIHRRTGAMAA